MLARGRPDGDLYRFEGGLKELPGVAFQSVMTPIEEDAMPIAGGVGEGGIVNGLYSIHIRMLDGVEGGLTGVMLLNDGRILGGDALFYYLGSYTSENGRWKGQILNQEHTPAKGENPIFGGHEVGIGFSGTCDEQGALLEATALAGKRSLRLTAVLKLMRRAVASEARDHSRALDAGPEGRGPAASPGNIEAASGMRIDADFAPTLALLERLRGGEAADLVILTREGLGRTRARGPRGARQRVDLARSYVGIAVKAGAAHPDIASEPALRATLLGARAVAYSRIGASGILFAN